MQRLLMLLMLLIVLFVGGIMPQAFAAHVGFAKWPDGPLRHHPRLSPFLLLYRGGEITLYQGGLLKCYTC